MHKVLFLLIIICANTLARGQSPMSDIAAKDTMNITFRDTIFNFAFGSATHNLGFIVPTNENNRLVKYFKYVGTEPLRITRAWTGDPHFIDEYPREPLIPNKVYSFTILFWHQGKQGGMTKQMGFNLSDGNTIILRFTGKYLPLVEEGK